MVYVVKSFGTAIEFTRKFKEAQDVFKDARSAEIWGINPDGSAKLYAKKG